jgi:hypothetical protein
MAESDKSVVVLPNRVELVKAMPKNAVCAEIGVYLGFFSKRILRFVEPKKLHMIDCWSSSEDYIDYIQDISPLMWDSIFSGLVETYRHNETVEIHRGLSEDVLLTFPDDYFDWVYIDACHLHEYVKTDLRLCHRKVKDGGYILGHDMNMKGVKKAVYEMVNSHVCEFAYFTLEPVFFSYGLRVLKTPFGFL